MSDLVAEVTQAALHLRDTGIMETLGEVFGRGVATAFFAQMDALDKAKDAAPATDPRLYIAGHALQGLLANPSNYYSPANAAELALAHADRLLAELAKTSPAAVASPSAADVARLERALLHATSPCAGAGAMEMRAGEPYEPACEDCREVGEVLDELRKRQEAQRA